MCCRHPIRRGMDGVAVGEKGAAGVESSTSDRIDPRIRRQSGLIDELFHFITGHR